MTLTINREQAFVNQFHYDARNFEWEAENETPETNLNVQFQLVTGEQVDSKIGPDDTALHAVLTFVIPLETIIISGFVSQMNYIQARKIESQDQLEQEEMAEIAAPLFDLLQRLTYETTEVALDQPGINLQF